jgi:hypothetical protein
LRTKEVVEIPSIYNKLPKVTHIAPEYKMNFDQILDKPFLVTTVNWSTSATNFTELWRLPFPSSIMTNPLAKVPFDAATFFQARMCCMLQVSGTPMHQGLILVAALPHGTPAITNPNQILSAPHVFLNATESTSVCLECPMYTPSSVYRTLDPSATTNNIVIATSGYGTDVFDLVFFVMDALTVSSGSATSISISVHNIFKEAQFYVPKVGLMSWQSQCGVEKLWAFKSRAKISTQCACGKKKMSDDKTNSHFVAEGLLTTFWKIPTKIFDGLATGLKVVAGDLIDYGRGMVAQLTGFHNPNVPIIEERMLATFRNFPNNVDQPVHLEVLDNHAQFSRIYDDYYFRTEQDEMDLKFLTSKPVFVGKFSVLSTDTAGKNLFAYPMTPMVEASVSSGVGNTSFYSPLRTIYEASRFWRGDLKMHIQAVCTNFHFCKLIVLKNYAMTDAPINYGTAIVPAYNNIHNINTDTLEFSAGGQIQTIDLKYNSNLRQIECTKDYALNAISHGIAYGYLVQPLTYNSNVPTTITFNVYISGGDDLQFSGYALDPVNVVSGTAPTYPGIPNFFKNELGVYEIRKDGSHTGRILEQKDVKKNALEVRKMNFLKERPEEYIVQRGDEWEDIAYITGNPLETLRNLNATTHNHKSPHYNMMKGPLLTRGEKLKFQKCWRRRSQEHLDNCFKAETMEMAEGTNALVTPNNQDAVLNKIVPCDEDIKMSFRPNTSVRDYLRFMYPQATVTVTPTTIKNVVAFDILSLTKAFTNADYFQAFNSLFLGTSGGFKLKFKISGVANASATFVPPSNYCISSAFLRTYPMSNTIPTDANTLTNFLTGITYNPSVKSFTAPQIEMQDYTRPYNNAGNSITSRPGSSFVLEMAIPNMNPFNFTGNAAKWFSATSDTENDFGVIYISYDASYDGTSYSPVNIIPFIGINDETRLGFQVYAPQKTIPTYTSSSPAITCRTSILHPTTVGGTYPNGIPINPMPLVGSSYYFNST